MSIDLSGLPDRKQEDEEERQPGIDLSGLPNRQTDQLRSAYRSDTSKPEAESKVYNLSRATGLPHSVVRNNPDKVQRLADEPDWDALNTTAPSLVRQLAGNPDLFRVAKGDLAPLSGFERTLRALPASLGMATLGIAEGIFRTPEIVERGTRQVRSMLQTTPMPGPVSGALEGLEGLAGLVADLPGDRLAGSTEIADAIARARSILQTDSATFGESFARLSEKGQAADRALQEALGGDLSGLGEVFTDPEAIVGFVGQALPSLLLAMKSGGSIPFIAYLEGTGKASDIADYERRLGRQIDDDEYAQAITQTALVNAVLEKTGLDRVLAKAGPGVVSQLKKIITAGLAEGTTEALQELNSNLSSLMTFDPEKDLTEGILASFIGGGGSGTGVSTIDALIRGSQGYVSERETEATRADRIKAVAQSLMNMARESKLRERNPDAFEETIGKAAQDTEGAEVFIDVDNLISFYQDQGMDINEAFEQLPEVRRQIEEAVALGGGDVVIPVEQVATRLVDRPEDLGLVDHIRFAPDQMSKFEAESFKQSSTEEMAEEADRILKKNKEDDAFTKSAKAIEDLTFEQLQVARRFNTDVNRAYATAVGNMYTVLAERLGMLPEEVAAKYPLNIRALNDQGPQIALQQSKVDPADIQRVEIEQDDDYVYHATNLENLLDITSEGRLRINPPNFGTDQNAWPDGSIENRSYFSERAETVKSFAPMEGQGVVVRSRKSDRFLKESGTGDLYSTEEIGADALEYLGVDGNWHALSGQGKLFQDESPLRRAQRNNLGLYSSVEQAVIDMPLPQWKKEDGLASGREIWAKLQKMPGVKKEELEWLGIEQFLTVVIDDTQQQPIDGPPVVKPKPPKWTRQQVVDFIRANGVTVEETVASEEKAGDAVVRELEWDNGKVWDDEEAWEHMVEDMMDEFDSADLSSDLVMGWGFDVQDWLENHREDILANYESTGISEEDSETILNGRFHDMVDVIERMGFDVYEDMQSEMRDAALEQAEQAAQEQYMEDPMYIYSTSGDSSDIELYIFGNDEIGYDIREYDWRTTNSVMRRINASGEPVYSLGEAQLQAEYYARDRGLLRDEESEETPKWEQFVTDGDYTNYREIKIKLPEISGEPFQETMHFPDDNIVTFLRVTDRDMVIDPTPRKVITKIVHYDNGSITVRGKRRGMVEGWYIQHTYEDDGSIKFIHTSPYRTEEAAQAVVDSERNVERFGERDELDELETYFIDEFQSDWHQAGRQQGYRTGKIDVEAIRKQRNDVLRNVQSIIGDIYVENMERAKDAPTAFHERVYEIARNEGLIPRAYVGLDSLQHYQNAKEWIDRAQDKISWEEIKNAVNEHYRLQKIIDAEERGITDAPFKGNGWIELGLKRAIVDAVENGYEAIAWADSGVLADRWSGQYSTMYETQYDKKMPSIVKKLTGQKPVHLDLDGKPFEVPEIRVIKEKSETGDFYYWEMDYRDGERVVSSRSATDGQFANEFSARQAAQLELPQHADQGYWIIPITDELRDKIKAEGLPLFQGGKRGEFIPDTRTIVLLENADLSTFIHELGHFQLEVLAEIASQADAPQSIKTDMQTLLDWFGVDDLSKWNRMTLEEKREHHEKFARGFEAYLFKGETPNSRLADIFSRFRSWLVRIYKQISNLNVRLTPEVTQVFDRLVATEAQIAEAEALAGFRALFKSEDEAGMSPGKWQSYQAEGREATEAANRDMAERSMRDMQWMRNARNRELKRLQDEAKEKREAIRNEVQREVMSEPIQQAIRFLKTGEIADGEDQVKVVKGHKLALDALQQMYPESAPGNPDWQRLRGRGGVISKDGIHPDLVAPIFGFRNGYDLVESLLEAEDANEKIDAFTDQRMLERYGELADEVSIQRAADEAIHNETRTRFVATELVALEKATGKKKLLLRAAREYARQAIANLQVRKLKRANRYSVAERKAARNSEMALRRGEREEAARHKRSQLISNLMYREALNAKREVEKILRYFARFNSEGVRKNRDVSYLDQIDQLLERYDLRPSISQKKLDKRASLNAWIESQKQAGIEPEIDPKLLNEAQRIHYSRMTLDELRGLYDSIRSIDHVAKLKKKLLTAKDEREFNERIDESVESIEANATKVVKERVESNTTLDSFREGKNEFFVMHRKLASLIRQMDGFKDGGPLWELFIRPMNERADKEAVMREQATIRLDEILRPIFSVGNMTRKVKIPGVRESISVEARFVMALNTGNEVNYQRLIDGETGKAFTEGEIRAILDSMSKQEWDAVQAVWDFIDEYWTEIAAKQRRVTGVAPEKVEARPVLTPHGEYRGGYYPIKYNPERSQKSKGHEIAEIADMMKRGGYGNATTRRGHTKARAESGTGPLRYDLSGLFQHIDQVVHDLVWHEWAIDTNRIFNNSKFDQAVRTHYGPEAIEMMRAAREDIIVGDVPARTRFEKIINHLRYGVSIVGMGWNVFTSALQPLGLTQSMVRIGPAHVARGMAKWLASGDSVENSVDWIWEQSSFMRLRHKTMQREINEIRNRVAGKKLTNVQQSFFYFIVKAQQIADVPTWLGQYYKSMEAGEEHDRAVALADQAVLDSQGGGSIKDLAQIQRGGPLLKIWTNFYSFFNTTYNLMAESVARTKFSDPVSVGRMAVDFALLSVVPATLSAFLREAIFLIAGGDDEEKKEENLIAWLARENISYLTGTMVGLRELSSVLQGYFGYSGPAGTRFFNDLSRLSEQIMQGEVDEAAIKSANKVAGTALHYPAGQVERTAEGVIMLYEGETQNPLVLLTGEE